MTLEEAIKVLSLEKRGGGELRSYEGGYISHFAGGDTINLDGHFSAEQLEAALTVLKKLGLPRKRS